MKTWIAVLVSALSFCLFNARLSIAFAQGSLTPPPGPPGPVMKSLDQIEPRTPISSIPFTITASGSYYLTANLTASTQLANGITVQADNVAIDLNGFDLSGPFNYGGTAIAVVSPYGKNFSVRNGTMQYWITGVNATNASGALLEGIRGYEFNDNGLELGVGGIVRNCTVGTPATSGGGEGILVGNNSLVDHCSVYNDTFPWSIAILTGTNCVVDTCTAGSGTQGIVAGNGCTIKHCSAGGNRWQGILTGLACTVVGCSLQGNDTVDPYFAGLSVGSACTVVDCTVVNNAGGIVTGDACTVQRCSMASNAAVGLTVGNGCTVSACTATYNGSNGIVAASECTLTGCTASANSGDGIETTYSCLVKGNTCSSNSRYVTVGGAGIHVLYSGNRVEDNVLNSDQYGLKVDGNENFIIRNAARASGSVNYNIVAGNMVGLVTNALSSAAILGSTGGAGLGTTDPSANFSY